MIANTRDLQSLSFNPRPRMGGDIRPSSTFWVLICFNPRPRMGGDSSRVKACSMVRLFQSAPPHGGRLAKRSAKMRTAKFQSAPPHGGRRELPDNSVVVIDVSIRAPAWGATPQAALVGHQLVVSIRAPAWGATRRRTKPSATTGSFNPRPRMGGDGLPLHRRAERRVSIRAPAWGATPPPTTRRSR